MREAWCPLRTVTRSATPGSWRWRTPLGTVTRRQTTGWASVLVCRKSPARPDQISSIILYIVQRANKKMAGRGKQIVFSFKPEGSEKIQNHSWNCSDRGYNFYVRHFSEICLFLSHCLFDNMIGHRCICPLWRSIIFCHIKRRKIERKKERGVVLYCISFFVGGGA